jgi:hypothetical protein
MKAVVITAAHTLLISCIASDPQKNPHSEEQGRHCTYNKTMRRVRVTLLLWKTKTFTDSSNIRFHENVPSGSPGVPRGRTDGQT